MKTFLIILALASSACSSVFWTPNMDEVYLIAREDARNAAMMKIFAEYKTK